MAATPKALLLRTPDSWGAVSRSRLAWLARVGWPDFAMGLAAGCDTALQAPC